MSSVLEPSFLLELGAYAVTVAGIRLFKNRYRRAGSQPSAKEVPDLEQPEPVQAAPAAVLGLGHSSPLRPSVSPCRSRSPSLHTGSQLATPVVHPPLHEADSRPISAPTSPLDRQPCAVAAPVSAPEPPAAAGTPGTSAHATAVAPDEEMLDIATSELEPDDGADADMQTQPAQEPNHVSISHSDLSYDNMADAPLGDDSLADAPMDDDSIPDTELYEGTPPGPPPPHMPVPDCFQSGMEEEEQGQELQPVTQLAPFFAAEELDASCPSDSQKAGLHPARGSPSPSGRRSPAATGPNRPSDLVSELGPPPNAGVRGGQGAPLPLTTATTDEHRQAASSSREAKGGPIFKLVLACGPTEKICGAELVARTLRSTARGSNLNGSAEPAAGSSSDTEVAAEQAGEEADKEGDDIMCEASVEGICADLSKDVSQDGGPRSFQRHAGIAAQHGSSAGLVMDGSGSDDEVEPGLAEEAVVTRRDILLRAVKQRKRNIADNSVTINSLFNSRKKQCGGDTGAELPEAAGTTSAQPSHPSGSNETKAEAEELHSGPPAGHAELFKQMSAAVNRLLAGAPHPDPSAQASHPDPTPPSPTLPLPGVEQDPCVGFASSSDGKPQPEEEEEGWLPLCSRAVAPEPKGHVPRAGSVFDEAPMPPAAAEFDEALVTVDGFLHDGNSGEEEQRQALSRQPDQAMKARAACEEAEEQGQSQLQESRHESPGTHARHDSPGSYAQHDSPAHHAQHDRRAEAGWTRAHILPQVESAPPVTPDSPNHSSASPSSPGWGFSEGGWDPSTRAMLYTHQHPAWDSPPGAAPTSPAPACAVADNSCARRSGHRAASGSPAPVALSPHDPAWHSPPPSQANTPLHGSTSPLSPSEGHPSGMDVAGGLGGVNSAQYGSYCSRYPLTPDDPRSWSRARSPGLEFEVYSPRYDSSSCHGSQRLLSSTPHSPSSPHSNPPPQAETHINRWRWWRPRTPASRAATMDAPGGFTASPHPPTHPEGPGGPGEEADKEGPELGATTRGQAGSRAYPKSRQRKVIDDHEDSLGGATAAYSREPVPGIQQAQATEDGLVDQPSVVERNARTVIAVLEVVRAGLNSAAEVRAVSEGRAASLPAQPSHEAPLESPPSVECVSEDSPQYPPSLTGRHHPEEAGLSPGWSGRSSSPERASDRALHRSTSPSYSSGSRSPQRAADRPLQRSRPRRWFSVSPSLKKRLNRPLPESRSLSYSSRSKSPGRAADRPLHRSRSPSYSSRSKSPGRGSDGPLHRSRSPRWFSGSPSPGRAADRPLHRSRSRSYSSRSKSPDRGSDRPLHSSRSPRGISGSPSPERRLNRPLPRSRSPSYSSRSKSPNKGSDRPLHRSRSPRWFSGSPSPGRASDRPLHRSRSRSYSSRSKSHRRAADRPLTRSRSPQWFSGSPSPGRQSNRSRSPSYSSRSPSPNRGSDRPLHSSRSPRWISGSPSPERRLNRPLPRSRSPSYSSRSKSPNRGSDRPRHSSRSPRGFSVSLSPRRVSDRPLHRSRSCSYSGRSKSPNRVSDGPLHRNMSPNYSRRSRSPSDRPLHRSRASRHDEYPSKPGSPTPSDKEEIGADDSQGRDEPGALELDSSVVKTLEDQLKTLVEHLQHQGAAAASSPAPVSLTQAEEEEPVDEPAAVGQGHAWDSPRGSPVDGAGAAFSPQPEDLLDREEPGMMLEGEEGYDGDEVQFVSETGPDPSRSAFASAVKRLAAARASPDDQWPSLADQEEDIELYPGVQDLISSALVSRRGRHGRHSVEDDMGIDKSRGRSPARRQERRHKRRCSSPGARRCSPTLPEAGRSSPGEHGRRRTSSRRHERQGHSTDRGPLFPEDDIGASSLGVAASLSASVLAAAVTDQAGAAAGSYARRMRECLSVAEGEDEEDEVDADRTCWRRLLKKSRHH